jgi:ABC-2 type transport system permease protein
MKLHIPKPHDAVSCTGLCYREINRFFKVYAQTIVGPIVTALLFMTVFVTSLKDSINTINGIPFPTFLGAGLVMMTIIQNSFANSASSLSSMKAYGTISDLLSAPISSFSVVFAFTIGGIVRGLVTGAACLIIFIPFTDFSWHQPLFVIAFTLLGASLLAITGFLSALWSQKWDHNAAFTNFIITPLSFLSGTFYSIERLPPFFHQLSLYNPFFYAIDGFRYGLTGSADANPVFGIFFLLACNLALFALATRLFHVGWRIKS